MQKIENDHIDNSDLILRYLSGNADAGEIESLEDWVLASDENKNQFIAFKKAWILAGISTDQKPLDIDKEWDAFKTKVRPVSTDNIRHLETKKKYDFRFFARYAAVLVFLIASTVVLYKFLNTNKATTVITQQSIKTNKLHDGTQITLNSNSEISYSFSEKSNVREVELKGDAYFDVKRDTNRVFKVQADDITVQVLGTEFYVDARKDQPMITVIVRSGSVSVKSATEEIILAADEVGFYDRESRILLKSHNTDVNYMSWKTRYLVFEKTDMERVVFDLNRMFNTDIKIENPELKSCKITATFNNKSLDAIIKIIEKTLKIKSSNRDGEIILSGEACN